MTTKLDKAVSEMVKEIDKEDTCFFCKKLTRGSDVLNLTASQIMCPDGKLHICHNRHHGVTNN